MIRRQDYLDPNTMPMSLTERVDNLTNVSGGIQVSENKYLLCNEVLSGLMLLGQDHVEKGHSYFQGWRPQNYQEAARHYAKAVKLKNADGMFFLARLHLDGKRVKQDLHQALELLNAATKMPPKLNLTVPVANVKLITSEVNVGVYSAQQTLGLFYYDGVKFPKNYSKAALNGSGQAALNLGCMYQMGEGVPQDMKGLKCTGDWP